MVLLSLHDLATGRSVLGVSFITSLKSNLRTALTPENTVIMHAQNAIALQTRLFLTGHKQRTDGSPQREPVLRSIANSAVSLYGCNRTAWQWDGVAKANN
jgi:hypothetical protein